MSIPNYKVVVQTEFKPKASLICSLKQGALLIKKKSMQLSFLAAFVGRVSQEQETHRDSWFCIVASLPPPTLHIQELSRSQRSMTVFPSDFNSQANVFLLLKYRKYNTHYSVFLFY